MASESLLAMMPIPPVHAKPDVGHVNPDGQKKRGEDARKEHRDRDPEASESHPVPNTRGQITGKLIDTTA